VIYYEIELMGLWDYGIMGLWDYGIMGLWGGEGGCIQEKSVEVHLISLGPIV
jgi:hypothetical protein